MTTATSVFPPLDARPLKETIVLFDVDETLTKARQVLPWIWTITPEMLELLSRLRHKCAIGYVGGSNFVKQQEQLGSSTVDSTTIFDSCFPENGLVAYRLGRPLSTNSFIQWLGENRYQDLQTFVWDILPKSDFLGSARSEFEAYDKIHNIRRDMVEALKKQFADFGLTFSIGGQISFDVFPTGWDKTYCLQHVAAEKEISGTDYKNIHFFGDKCFEGGNDYEIYSDSRTMGHSVDGPDNTMKQLKEIFNL
ncbi:Phosphomannomutase [Penicillium malachiteum]|uniref:Phosphomannomutase n=1 Tax=Penicillium malachiteum TaxID=1324776 RepID=UPI0025467AD8|nr:Phosphomannomutase [Penicillium malachiteum]KAJ5736695.1 Phosphomannomutase [Penicillium malachiteum]